MDTHSELEGDERAQLFTTLYHIKRRGSFIYVRYVCGVFMFTNTVLSYFVFTPGFLDTLFLIYIITFHAYK